MTLTDAQRLKLEILASGIVVDDACATALAEANEHRALTPADYASTSGLILRLDDAVWVNAPVAMYNPNFVTDSPFVLARAKNGFQLAGNGLSSGVSVWLPPAYHDRCLQGGRPWTNFVFTHGDRARLAPIGGCAMRCKFCNLPYEDPYETKPPHLLVEAVRVALDDPLQPARHLLISGGTPAPADVPYLRDVYRDVLRAFPDIDVDIMMAPVDGLFELRELRDLGLHELSVNIEVYDRERARTLMPHKYRQGLDNYLNFIEGAAQLLGPGRVRSMLMVGLEDHASTLRGVEAILNAGGIPVLSPFRPDPSTPMRDQRPPTAGELHEVYLAADAVARKGASALGPSCAPCTHNTLTFVEPASASEQSEPVLIG